MSPVELCASHPELHADVRRKTEAKEGSGGTSANRRFFEMPGSNGNIGKLAAYDVKTMRENWKLEQTRLATSVQGFPVSFSVGGKQYIAVSTGLGGGSPWQVPATIAPDIHHPANGNALYMFALPDSK